MEGGYLGPGPPSAQAGDMICLLRGHNYPVLLRSQGDHFAFVAECFVFRLNGERGTNAFEVWSGNG